MLRTIVIFDSQKIVIFGLSRLDFWKTCQDSKKLLYQLLVGMFMDKFENFCDNSMILWEMTNGWIPLPPASFRVKFDNFLYYPNM
jgi:hypothetical protein